MESAQGRGLGRGPLLLSQNDKDGCRGVPERTRSKQPKAPNTVLMGFRNVLRPAATAILRASSNTPAATSTGADILAGVFTPVLAKHSKLFSLIDCISVGVDRIQRNFEPRPRQVEVCQGSELTFQRIPPTAMRCEDECQVKVHEGKQRRVEGPQRSREAVRRERPLPDRTELP
jgi:hypothetical protein